MQLIIKNIKSNNKSDLRYSLLSNWSLIDRKYNFFLCATNVLVTYRRGSSTSDQKHIYS